MDIPSMTSKRSLLIGALLWFALIFLLALANGPAAVQAGEDQDPVTCVDPVMCPFPTPTPTPTQPDPNATSPSNFTPVNPGDATGHPGDAFCLIYNCHEVAQPAGDLPVLDPILPDTAMGTP